MENYANQVCTNCGTPFGEGQAFCAKCGAPKPVAPQVTEVPQMPLQQAPQPAVCGKCGTPLQPGQEFCSCCGQRAGLVLSADVNNAINQFNANLQKKQKSKAPLIIGILAGVAAVVVAAVLLLTPKVESVTLSAESVELRVGDSTKLTYTIEPKKADDAEVEWTSSDTSVARVSNKGEIEATGEGTCRITIKAGDKRDTVSVKVVKLYPEEKKAVGTWEPIGYFDEYDDFKALPSYTGDFCVYNDFTGRVTVGDKTYDFTWEFSKQSEEIYIYDMKLSNGNKFQFGIMNVSGDECLVFMLESMKVVYEK